MATTLTFQVLDGIDKGKVFRNLPLPVTIGREEGNVVRLNDERVSRFHAKIQMDNNDIILTDLDSTNGTRVNGNPVQIRRLRPGDQVGIGRSTLLFGSFEEIRAYQQSRSEQNRKSSENPSATIAGELGDNLDFDLNFKASEELNWLRHDHDLPPLPEKLSPAATARFAEILDFLHRGLSDALENISGSEDGSIIQIDYQSWQRIQAVQMLLARYMRALAEPGLLDE
jgi:pSer/pThr/pTyr-binding forkhead associated (FHA) protein